MIDLDSFDFEIISPQESSRQKIYWVEIESPTGSFFVGPQHSPLVSTIKRKSFVVYKKIDALDETKLMVHEGFFKINAQGQVTLVITL